MRTISIFLASSITELADDRDRFGEFIRKLNDIYEKRNTQIKLVRCEDLEINYPGRPTQEVLNEKLQECQMFVALFYKKAGAKTLEEFEIALKHFRKEGLPKIAVFMKDVDKSEIKPELEQFRDKLDKNLGYYWASYDSKSKLQAEFLMWLLKMEFLDISAIRIENDQITIDGLTIAQISELPFVSNNPEFQNLCKDLLVIPKKIEEIEKELKEIDSNFLQKERQQLKDLLDSKIEDLVRYLQSMQDMTKLISKQRQELQTGRLKEAIDAFKADDWQTANALLKTITKEAEPFSEGFEQSRHQMHQYIEAYRMRALTVMTEFNLDIHDRINQATKHYETADDWAQKSGFDDKNYVQLLFDYAAFLKSNSRFEDAEHVYLRLIEKLEKNHGSDYTDNAIVYHNLGYVYMKLGDTQNALEYYNKALKIRQDDFGEDHPDTATTYNNIGFTYFLITKREKGYKGKKEDYDKALNYLNKAKKIREKVFGTDHFETADTYYCLSMVYNAIHKKRQYERYLKKVIEIRKRKDFLDRGDLEKASYYDTVGYYFKSKKNLDEALDYFKKALSARKKNLGHDNTMIADSYERIGTIHEHQGKLDYALDAFSDTLSIRVMTLGENHPQTAATYERIAVIYNRQKKHNEAIQFYIKALDSYQNSSEVNSGKIADIQEKIGIIYRMQNDNPHAIEYYLKALNNQQKRLGEDHEETIKLLKQIGKIYEEIGEIGNAIKYYEELMDILERVSGGQNPKVADFYFYIGLLYKRLSQYSQTHDCFAKSQLIRMSIKSSDNRSKYHNIIYKGATIAVHLKWIEELKKAQSNGEPSMEIAQHYFEIAEIYYDQGDYGQAISNATESLSIYENYFSGEHPMILKICGFMGSAYKADNNYAKAAEYYQKSLDVFQEYLVMPNTSNTRKLRGIAHHYSRIGEMHFLLGDYQTALKYHTEALQIVEKIGVINGFIASHYYYIGKDYEGLGEYQVALNHYTTAFDYYNTKYGTNDSHTLKIKECIDRVEEKLRLGSSSE